MRRRLSCWSLGIVVAVAGFIIPLPIGKSSEFSVVLAQTVEDRKAEADRLFQCGYDYYQASQFYDALACWQAALEIYREIGNRTSESDVVGNLAAAYLVLGKYQEAINFLEQSLNIYRDLDNLAGEGRALGNLGNAYLSLGEYHQAINFYQQDLAIARETSSDLSEARALGNLGIVYSELGQYQQAIDLYQQTLAIYRKTNNRAGEGTVLGNLGNTYSDLGEYQQAIELYKQRLAIAHEIGDRAGEGTVLGNLGNAYSRMGEYQQAIDLYKQGLAIAREIGDRAGEGNVLGNLGATYRNLGQYQQAIDFYEQGLAIAREIGDRASEGIALGNLGTVYDNLGQYQQAVDFYEQGLAIAREIGNRASEGIALGNLGATYRNLGQYQQAINFCEQGLTVAREIGDRTGEGNILGNLGATYLSLSQYQQAIDLLNQQLSITREIGDSNGEETALGNLSIAYYSIGQYQQAIDLLNQQLSIVREIGDRAGEGTALGNLGVVAYLDLGEYQQAIELLNQQLSIAREIGDRAGEGTALGNLGAAYLGLGKYQQAIELLNQQLSIAREVGDYAGEVPVFCNLGIICSRFQQYNLAFEFYQQQLSIAREVGDRSSLIAAFQNLGSLFELKGILFQDENQKEISIAFYKQSINMQEEIRSDILGLPLEDQLIYYNQLIENPYRDLANLLLQENRLVEAQQVLELLKLEEIREYTRNRDAVPTSEGIRYTPAEQQVVDKFDRLIELRQRINQCQQTNCSELSSLQTQQQTLQKDYDQLVQSLETTNQPIPDYDFFGFAGLENTAWDIVEAQPATMVIYPLLLNERLWLLWIAPDGQLGRVEVSVTQAEIGEAAIQFRSLLDNPYSDIGELQATAQQLYGWLIQPLADEIEAHQVQNLVFSLDRATRYIPMAALFDGEQYLIENYAVSTIVSAGLTDTQDRLPIAPQDNFVLAMGLSKAKSGFNALPNVPIELDAIVQDDAGDTLGVYPGAMYLDEAFTIDALKRDLPQHSILHIATHAQFDPDSPFDSYLLLGNGEPLQISEINSLSDLTNVSLVVLSACQTALGGPDEEGLEIAGLGLYFLDGNGDRASSLAASLWQVSDRSTSDLMQRFYQTLASGTTANPITKAEALRQAQLSLLYGQDTVENDGERFIIRPISPDVNTNPAAPQSHPYYWAPFMLIGNHL